MRSYRPVQCLIALGVGAVVLALSGCEVAPSPVPTSSPSPVVLNLTLTRTPEHESLGPGEQVALTARLEPYIENARYDWAIVGTAGGTLDRTVGRNVVYTAGRRDGVDTVTVRVAALDAVAVRDITFVVHVPTPTPTVTPSPTSTPTPTPTEVPPPTGTPTPSPKPTSVSLTIADFNTCHATSTLGGAMGAAYEQPNRLTETYVPEPRRGCVVRLDYHMAENGWTAFWIKLSGKGQDLSRYRTLGFWARSEPGAPAPAMVKIELKRADNQEVAAQYLPLRLTPEDGWFNVALDKFRLSARTQMSELVFTFEAAGVGTTGVLVLDSRHYSDLFSTRIDYQVW